jgi:hypothetical protein
MTELSLQVRVDTPWQRVRDHILYALRTVELIPIGVRLLLFLAVSVIGVGLAYRSLKVVSFGIDVLFFSLLFIGGDRG